MKKSMILMFALALALWAAPVSFAAEHGGTEMKEHGGSEMKEHSGDAMKEHGGTETQEQGGTAEVQTPSADDIHAAMKKYIEEESQETGTFDVEDPETGETRKLTMERIHDRVGKTGGYYYSCADFRDTVSGELLDLDLDVEEGDGGLGVEDVRIHKVDGKERYTYDADDNRIPLAVEE